MRPGGMGISLSRDEGADALAAAALAHQGQRFTFLDVVGDAVHGLDYTFLSVEVGPEVFDL